MKEQDQLVIKKRAFFLKFICVRFWLVKCIISVSANKTKLIPLLTRNKSKIKYYEKIAFCRDDAYAWLVM